MRAADEIAEPADGVFFWQHYEPAVKCDLSSCALLLGQELFFVDPVALRDDLLARLVAIASPGAVLLTNGNHARAAGDFRKRFGIPIWSHRDAVAELGIPIDRTVEDGEEIKQNVSVVTLPGAGPGEIAFHDSTRGLMLVGDALINLPPRGLAVLPDRYCSDAAAMRVSLRKLLRFEFQLLTFAHGLPLVSGAAQRLATLLA